MRQNPRRGWKRPLTLALKIAFSGGLLAWILHKTDLASIGQSLVSASPRWLALALAMGIAGTMVQAKQWQRLLLAVGLDRSITRCRPPVSASSLSTGPGSGRTWPSTASPG